MRYSILFILLALCLPVYGQTPTHRLVIPTATRVDLSHLGVHTHADLVLFQLSAPEALMLQDSSHARVIAHCRLPTNRAAMPPGFEWLTKDYGAIPTYGSIDGSPGWSVSDVFTKHGKKFVKVSVPSRFANWVASQTSALRQKYQNPRNYSLEIRWEQKT